MKAWARFPIVALVVATFLWAGTAAAAASSAAGGSSDETTGVTTSDLSTATVSTADDGATVIQDLACGIATPPFGGISATDSIFVLTPSGHATLVCHGDLPAGVGPTSAIVIPGLLCFAPGVTPTTQSHTTISPSGEVTLVCQFMG